MDGNDFKSWLVSLIVIGLVSVIVVGLVIILYPLGGLLYLAGFTGSELLLVLLFFVTIFSLPLFLILFEIILFGAILFLMLKMIGKYRSGKKEEFLRRMVWVIALTGGLTVSVFFHQPYWVSYAHGSRDRILYRTELPKELSAIRKWFGQFEPTDSYPQDIPLEMCPAIIKNLGCKYIARGYEWKEDGSGDQVEVLIIGFRGVSITIGPEDMEIPKSTEFLHIMPFGKGAYIKCGLRG